jgi:hypothetical protein
MLGIWLLRHHGLMPAGEWIRVLERADASSEPRAPEAVLLNYPVSLGAAQSERSQDLLREFQLMAAAGAHEGASSALARLELLAEELMAKYGPDLAEPPAELRRAIRAREATTVLRYPLFPITRSIILDYARMMEGIDASCRDAAMMTLQPSPQLYALRRWTVEEFVRQYDGRDPRPWPR